VFVLDHEHGGDDANEAIAVCIYLMII